MAGHSHSANIKFRKDRVDAKRAKAFSKMARMITVAAKLGGGDPDANPRLRLALEKARVVNMPKDNISRAIKKGTGEGEAGDFEELVYEGYGPGGVGIIVDALTDNRNRTSPEVRKLFERSGGSLASTGAVSRTFQRKAVFAVEPAEGATEDQLMEVVLEAGADDLIFEAGRCEVHAEPGDFVAVKEALEAAGLALTEAAVAPVPTDTVEIGDVDAGRKVANLIDALEEHDDVQNVSANYTLTDEVAEKLVSDS